MNWNISRDPLSSGGASPSARPSVFCNLSETFTPVAAPRQPCIRIGFPSGRCAAAYKTLQIQRTQRIARSTESGFPLKAVNPPDTEFGRRFCRYVTCFIRGCFIPNETRFGPLRFSNESERPFLYPIWDMR